MRCPISAHRARRRPGCSTASWFSADCSRCPSRGGAGGRVRTRSNGSGRSASRGRDSRFRALACFQPGRRFTSRSPAASLGAWSGSGSASCTSRVAPVGDFGDRRPRSARDVRSAVAFRLARLLGVRGALIVARRGATEHRCNRGVVTSIPPLGSGARLQRRSLGEDGHRSMRTPRVVRAGPNAVLRRREPVRYMRRRYPVRR